MKLIGRIWLFVLMVGGLVAILLRDGLAGMIGLPAQNGPYIVLAAGIAMIALAIAPRFLFRRG
jgi:hypothetical protein